MAQEEPNVGRTEGESNGRENWMGEGMGRERRGSGSGVERDGRDGKLAMTINGNLYFVCEGRYGHLNTEMPPPSYSIRGGVTHSSQSG